MIMNHYLFYVLCYYSYIGGDSFRRSRTKSNGKTCASRDSEGITRRGNTGQTLSYRRNERSIGSAWVDYHPGSYGLDEIKRG